MRIFAISDPHTYFRANRTLLDELPRREYRRDVLLVAGDIAGRLTVIGDTLGVPRSRFSEVFYSPGKHGLRVRDGRCDSLEKLGEVLSLWGLCSKASPPTRGRSHGSREECEL